MFENNIENSWMVYRKMVLAEIKRLDDNITKLEEKSAFNLVEISKLKIYAILYGGISGAICAIIFKEVIQRW